MNSIINKAGNLTEFEAFTLNEMCQFTGAFLQFPSLRWNVSSLSGTYELGRIREGVSAESVDENVDEPEDDGYLCGQTGCGSALYTSWKKLVLLI